MDFCGNLTFDRIVVLVAKAITSRQRLKDCGWIDADAEQAQSINAVLGHLAHMRGEDYSDAVDAFWNGAPTKRINKKRKK